MSDGYVLNVDDPLENIDGLTDEELAQRAAADFMLRLDEARKRPIGLYKLLFTDEKGRPVVIKPFHEEWEEIVLYTDPDTGGNQCIIEAPRESCKCRISGQRITMASGVRLPVEDLAGRGWVNTQTYNEATRTVEPGSVLVSDNGEQPIAQLFLSTGRELGLTLEEPLLTPAGWKPAGELRPGEYVATLRSTPEPENADPLPPGVPYSIGYLIGDGSCTGSQPRMSCKDPAILEHVEGCLTQRGVSIELIEGCKNGIDYNLKPAGQSSELLRQYGLHGKRSVTKRVHSDVFRAPNEDVAEFLAGYWDADGTGLSKRTIRKGVIDYTSTNKKLLEDVQHLLTRFGIASYLRGYTIKYVCKGERRDRFGWRLCMGGSAVDLFFQLIPCRSKKAKRSAKLLAAHRKRHSESGVALCERVPRQAVLDALSPFGEDFFRKRGIRLGSKHDETMSRNKVNRLAHALREYAALDRDTRMRSRSKARTLPVAQIIAKSEELLWLAGYLIVWDRINMVVYNHAQTWAVHNSSNQTFICEDGIAHNTTFLIAYCAWKIGRNPNIRIKWLCSDDPTAVKRLSVVHALLDAPIYQMIFPGVRKLTSQESKEEKRPNSATMLNVKRDFRSPEATVEAWGILSSGTGTRCDELLCDDVVSESNAILNPAQRPKVIAKFTGDWMATVPADGRISYIGTPWHKDDLLGYLKRRAGWRHFRYHHGKPGDPYHSIFPERWPREVLMKRRIEFGPLHYARAYLCEAFQEGTVVIRPKVLIPYTRELLTRDKLVNARALVCLDPSSGKKLEKGKLDYTGVCTFLYVDHMHRLETEEDYHGPPFEIFIPEAYQVKLPHVMQAKLAWQLVSQWRCDTLVIEAQGMQSLHAWMEELRAQDPTLPLVDIEPIASGNVNKGQRLVRVTPLLDLPADHPPLVYLHPRLLEENPTPYFIDVGGTPYEALRDLRGQLLGFPTEHDDILDAFAYGLYWIHALWVPKPDAADNQAPASFSAISL